MADPYPELRYPGLESVLSFDFTLTPGISPSVASIRIQPQHLNIGGHGDTLEFRYHPGGDTFKFKGCKLDKMSADKQAGSLESWTLTILDRRWKWQECGRISGRYNVREGNEEDSKLIYKTEKTPIELATLCLEAMGETGFKNRIKDLPDDTRPFVEWDYENPAQALASLCDQLGCYVVLNVDDLVYIHRIGSGKELPEAPVNGRPLGNNVLGGSIAPDPPNVPDSLVVVAGRTRVQMHLELEAIAKDLDGEFYPINEVLYRPNVNPFWKGPKKEAWQASGPPHFDNLSDVQARDYAKQYIFRYYRIKVPFKIPFAKLLGRGAKTSYEIESLDEILPIYDDQLLKSKGEERDKNKIPLPAWVYGIWYDDHELAANVTDKPRPDLIKAIRSKDSQTAKDDRRALKAAGLYDRGFQLDTQRGYVIFNEPMFRRAGVLSATLNSIHILAAKLWLVTSFSVRDKETLGWYRYEYERKNSGPKSGTLPRYVIRDELSLSIVCHYGQTIDTIFQTNNKEEVDKAMKHHMEILDAEYQIKTPVSLVYTGWRKIMLDGAIREITWSLGENGMATTRASRNFETPILSSSYTERRFLEKTVQRNKEAASGQKAMREFDRAVKKVGGNF